MLYARNTLPEYLYRSSWCDPAFLLLLLLVPQVLNALRTGTQSYWCRRNVWCCCCLLILLLPSSLPLRLPILLVKRAILNVIPSLSMTRGVSVKINWQMHQKTTFARPKVLLTLQTRGGMHRRKFRSTADFFSNLLLLLLVYRLLLLRSLMQPDIWTGIFPVVNGSSPDIRMEGWGRMTIVNLSLLQKLWNEL